MPNIHHRDTRHSPTPKEDRLALIAAAVHRRTKGVKKAPPSAAFNALQPQFWPRQGAKLQ
jgi:hypothetical protein